MITIVEAVTRTQLKEFVKFPFSLYKNNPCWVPPIIAEELESFNKATNPAFLSSEAYFYLAYRNNKIVGRVVAIINWDEVNILKKSKVRFGWFETIDDIEITKALLDKVFELGKKHNLEHAEGPMGFSNLDKVGVLTEGFEELGNMITWYSPKYYVEHFEKLGFVVEKKYIESEFSFKNVKIEPYIRASKMIKERYKLKVLTFKKSEDIMPHVDKMFDLFNDAYAKLQSFVAINDIQKEYFKKKYISFINPEYIIFIEDEHQKMIAFAIVMPNFAQALQKIKGKLFPFGFFHLLQARKKSKEAVFYLIGITEEYQSKGVTAAIFEEYHRVFSEKGIDKCIRTPELEDNIAIHNLWKNFNPRITKKRCTYKKFL